MALSGPLVVLRTQNVMWRAIESLGRILSTGWATKSLRHPGSDTGMRQRYAFFTHLTCEEEAICV